MIPLPSLDFGVNDTIEMLREVVRSFASNEIEPRAAAIDKDNAFPGTCGRRWATSGCTA